MSIYRAIKNLQSAQDIAKINEELARRQVAIDELKKAKTIEEIQKANENITINLP